MFADLSWFVAVRRGSSRFVVEACVAGGKKSDFNSKGCDSFGDAALLHSAAVPDRLGRFHPPFRRWLLDRMGGLTAAAASPHWTTWFMSVSLKKKVLLVDDDPEIIDSVQYALQGEGYEVVVARDGNQGLALAEREDPDLMILDMMMPKRSGFLVLEKLRRVHSTPLPVVMITGNEGSRHKAYAELLGVSDYIRKPFEMPRLLDAVKKLLA